MDVKEAIRVIESSNDDLDKFRAEAWLIYNDEAQKEPGWNNKILELIEDDDLHNLVVRFHKYQDWMEHGNFNNVTDGESYAEYMLDVNCGDPLDYICQFDNVDKVGFALYIDIRDRLNTHH